MIRSESVQIFPPKDMWACPETLESVERPHLPASWPRSRLWRPQSAGHPSETTALPCESPRMAHWLSLSPDPAPSVSACLQVLVWLWEVSLCFRSCRCQVPNIKLPCSLGKALGGSSWTVAQHPKQVWHTTTGPDIMMSKLLGRDLDDARET